MICVVVGGAGFIGSHLCDALLAAGHRVTCVDNFLTGDPSNIEHLRSNPDFSFFEHDVIQPLGLKGDAFFNLASPASPVGYRTYSIETLLVNSVGTYNILEQARKQNARFLMASTSESYGDPLQHPQKESYWGNVNPVGVRACYDEAKRFSEAITMEYHRKLGVDTRIVRIFNTYGPRNKADDGRVVPNFISQALRGEPLTIYGDGSQTRSFCFVSDLVNGLQKAVFSEGTKGQVINLGNPSEFTMKGLAELIIKLSESASSITYEPLPKGRTDDPMRRKPDISKARKLLGWEPLVSVEEGMARAIAWYREKAARPAA
ncbi:MAG TPA: UDP-glucuronic acid decarboxylase family protein [Armatimonadota bacterium]|jgi:nucleoside-diphosphate-sugar epimerase